MGAGADWPTNDEDDFMLRIAVTIAAVALSVLSAGADERAGSDLRAGLEELRARLGLTAEQETRARSIFEDHLAVQIATLEKYDVDADNRGGDTVALQQMRALREELRANRAKIEARLSGVLSETQLEEFRYIRAEQEEKLRERLLSKRLDEIGARLELTPEQTDRVRPVLKEHFEAQMAVLDRYDAMPSNRSGGKRPGFRMLRRLRKNLGEIRTRTLKRLSTILSEAQMAAYEALQAEQRKKLRALLLQR